MYGTTSTRSGTNDNEKGKRMKRATLCTAIACMTATANADIIHVPGQYPTIQIAIQQANPFDTVIVAPGEYFEAINFLGKSITVQSSNPLDPSVVADTVIDAMGLGAVVTFSGSETAENTALVGFTVTGGTTGINGNDTHASILNCVVAENTSHGIRDVDGLIKKCAISGNARQSGGAGVYACNASIEDCQIVGNAYGLHQCGGQVFRTEILKNRYTGVLSCSSRITQCRISGNGEYGLQQCSGPQIINSIISGNRSGGFYSYSTSYRIDVLNCTVTGNGGYGFYKHGGDISHAIIWDNNDGPLYDSTTPIYSGTANPFFVQPGYWNILMDTWTDGDYHVTSESYAIDAGNPFYADDPDNPTEDLDGNPRVAGWGVDIGAYEFHCDCEGEDFDEDGLPDNCDRDIDDDGVWNMADACDYTPYGEPVTPEGRQLADSNWDCVVNLADFAILQNSLGG